MTEGVLVSAFLVGLLGGVHCGGMCGGIVAALSLQLPGRRAGYPLQLAYNLGRVLSYGLAGTAAGMLGAGSLLVQGSFPVREALYVLANLMLILVGLYLAGIWQGVAVLERWGGVLWKRVQPLTRRLVPVDSIAKALASGILWGWLPCGLVYSMLSLALFAGSAAGGAAIMLAFGAGTLPNLLAMGFAAGWLQPLLQRRSVRLAAGLAVLGFGLLGLWRIAAHPFGPADFCAMP